MLVLPTTAGITLTRPDSAGFSSRKPGHLLTDSGPWGCDAGSSLTQSRLDGERPRRRRVHACNGDNLDASIPKMLNVCLLVGCSSL